MAVIKTFTAHIWPGINSATRYLITLRDDNMPQDIRVGINFSVILNSACLLEGMLEASLRSLLLYRRKMYNSVKMPEFEQRRAMNMFYNRIEKDLEVKIAKSVGSSGYDEMFELLIGTQLSNLDHIKPLWEGLTVLFQFRNVLGHGRPVMARQISAYFTKGIWEDEFSGSYRRVEEYLLKLKLIDKKFVEHASEDAFFSDKIADHFYMLVQKIPQALVSSLPDEESGVIEECLSVMLAVEPDNVK